jgi:hypothetical protein
MMRAGKRRKERKIYDEEEETHEHLARGEVKLYLAKG